MSVFLETKRLILKTAELSDLDMLAALRSDFEVMENTGYGGTQTKEEVREYLDFAISYQEKHGMGFCLVFEKESGSFIGEAGLFHLLFDDAQSEVELGYHLYKKFWGKGYGTELVRALIQWGFQHLSINKLVSTTYPDNIASQKVLIKAGFDCMSKKQLPNVEELFWYEIYKNDSIELVPYDPQWPEMAELEMKKLREILPTNHIMDIQHVGSTAIPEILSKPIIDIQITVDSLAAIKQTAIDTLKTCGYMYWAEDPDPEKLFFVKGMPPFGEKRTHHVHIIEPTSKRGQTRIIFRDYLIAHPEVAHEYEQLKIKLAHEYTYDREQYTDAKTQFIDSVLCKALATDQILNLTKYQEINNLLQQLLSQIQSILTNEFVGMYIGGSLASDSFNSETSDIDCYIITTKILSENMVRKIEEMHNQFYSSKLKYAKKIEASYIPQKDLLDFDPQAMRPYFNEGRYYLGHYGNNYLIELFVLREKALSIAGPDIKCLIKEISTQSLKAAIQKNLHEYWESNLIDFSKFKRSDYQVFAILTMCRTLYSLETGKITSKIEAAKWAMQRLNINWKNLIELAIAWEPSQEINKLEETQNFVRYVLNRSSGPI
ncbi:TPA: GNAT family N-acetyltransferase [Legionella pneumophila]|nr:GNAT family N-acetyltransferase [Legionella pneumophila]HBI2948047.1 GNAT family N-acetyltransferase [Legionella pneumophila]